MPAMVSRDTALMALV